METKKSYWIYQIIGWSLYFFSDLLNYFTIFSFDFDEFNKLIGNLIVNVAAGISLTHIFRIIFKRYHWIKLPVTQLIIRCAAVVAIITFVLAAINIPMDRDIINTEKMNWALRDISYLINLTKPVLIWVLLYVFYNVANLRKNDAVERVQLESSIKETEAKILRAQMNPHFIFNALNSIRALITEDPKKAMSGITQLSNLLRSSLVSHRRTTVSLKEEIKTIQDYLSLEKIRYEERLQIKWDIAKETEGIQVPPMMLQTLVENAIKHGVQKALRWGFIEISSHLEGQTLLIIIRNTGKLEGTDSKSSSGGFGLENTKRRLHLLYGNKSEFRIFQENHLTVNAEIRIPLDHQ
ncbi:sensor histidine kinase [Arcticibacterium luteifluviistationis]|uniref:Sensor histidine kinase n=1 Tax=Arcticibacterium luteifluviistationis TaxID=1784714 RepID=A0A2Z4GD18_9BACT|nr:histidine kinase [Arcticibacterium luteifluviistationis]AWV98978.1 sensor histidine kinase [Arcticibacterium luteifluviistationis]